MAKYPGKLFDAWNMGRRRLSGERTTRAYVEGSAKPFNAKKCVCLPNKRLSPSQGAPQQEMSISACLPTASVSGCVSDRLSSPLQGRPKKEAPSPVQQMDKG